jgi:hypothetical protein
LVAGLAEGGGDGIEGGELEGAGQFGAGNFNAGQVAMVANAELAEAEGAEAVFGLFDLLKDFAGDSAAVFDAGGETGRGGAVLEGVSGGAGESADFGFGEADFSEGREDGVFLCGALAGAEVAGVVGVHAVGDVCEAELRAESTHDVEELVFAMEAAVEVVAGILGAVELFGGDDVEGHAETVGEGAGCIEVAAGQRGRICDDGDHAGAEKTVRGGRQISRVDATGVGDHEAAQLNQTLLESLEFGRRKIRGIGRGRAAGKSCRHGLIIAV